MYRKMVKKLKNNTKNYTITTDSKGSATVKCQGKCKLSDIEIPLFDTENDSFSFRKYAGVHVEYSTWFGLDLMQNGRTTRNIYEIYQSL